MRYTAKLIEETFNDFLEIVGDEGYYLRYRNDNPETLTVIAQQDPKGGYTTPFGESYRNNKEMYAFLQGLMVGYHLRNRQIEEQTLRALWADESTVGLYDTGYSSLTCLHNAIVTAKEERPERTVKHYLTDAYHFARIENREAGEIVNASLPPVNLPASLIAKWEATKKLLGYS